MYDDAVLSLALTRVEWAIPGAGFPREALGFHLSGRFDSSNPSVPARKSDASRGESILWKPKEEEE